MVVSNSRSPSIFTSGTSASAIAPRTPSSARAGERSSRVTVPLGIGTRRSAAWSMPGELDVGRVARGAGDLLQRILARHALADDCEFRVAVPRLGLARRHLDDLGLFAPLDLDLGGDEALMRHRESSTTWHGSYSLG